MMKKFLVLPAVIMFSACSMVGTLGGNVPANLKKENLNLVASYTAASTSVLSGQKDLAQALNLKDTVSELDGQIKALESGNISSGTISKTTELSENVNKALTEKLSQGEELSSDAKVLAAKGLGKYAVGTASTVVLVNSAKHLVEGSKKAMDAKGVTPLDKAAIAENMAIGSAVMTQVPGLAKDLLTSGKQLIQFAKKAGVNTQSAQKTMSQVAGF